MNIWYTFYCNWPSSVAFYVNWFDTESGYDILRMQVPGYSPFLSMYNLRRNTNCELVLFSRFWIGTSGYSTVGNMAEYRCSVSLRFICVGLFGYTSWLSNNLWLLHLQLYTFNYDYNHDYNHDYNYGYTSWLHFVYDFQNAMLLSSIIF